MEGYIKDNLDPFYKLIVEQNAVGVHAINRLGKTIIYNEKMKEIEGLELDDIQDRTIVELFNFEQEESTLLKVLESGKPLLNVKQTYWNRNGIQITTINDSYPVYENSNLIGAVEFARDITALENLVHQPLQQHKELAEFSQITAFSTGMNTVIRTAKKAAEMNLPVLLIGEAGTGKDTLAQCIHSEQSSAHQNFYTLHCQSSDALSIKQLEKTLQDDASYTLFCERIDLLSIQLQQQLFAVIANKKTDSIQLIASIGEDPVGLIASGVLMKELYYFFSSFAIHIPPLRKRPEDILPFINAYLAVRQNQFNSSLQGITKEVETLFHSYSWPGNMRELEFLLDEVSSLVTTEMNITYDMLPLHFRLKNKEATENKTNAQDFIVQKNKDLLSLDQYLWEAEVYYVEKALKLYKGNITRTAKALGMSRQSLQYRLRKLNLS